MQANTARSQLNNRKACCKAAVDKQLTIKFWLHICAESSRNDGSFCFSRVLVHLDHFHVTCVCLLVRPTQTPPHAHEPKHRASTETCLHFSHKHFKHALPARHIDLHKFRLSLSGLRSSRSELQRHVRLGPGSAVLHDSHRKVKAIPGDPSSNQ